MAAKFDLTNKIVGKLTVISLVPKEERPTQRHGNYWLCKCECGNMVKVPTTYLTGNSNYTQTSCGCDRKKRAFQATTDVDVDDEFLQQFSSDFERYLFIHKALIKTSGFTGEWYNNHLDYYKEAVLYFWNNYQFNAIYDFWKTQQIKKNSYYDWVKPSLDHIIPKSRGGSNHYRNLQFLTTFENLAKRDMTQEEWNIFKQETHSNSDYYIEHIMEVSIK